LIAKVFEDRERARWGYGGGKSVARYGLRYRKRQLARGCATGIYRTRALGSLQSDMARPKKYEVRNQQLNLKLTLREMAFVRAAAEVARMEIVDFGRARVLQDAPVRPQSEAIDDRRAILRASLARLGNNLNQIARMMHANGGVAPDELASLLRDIRAVFERSVAGDY
jgi:hypothetical protein